MEKTTNFMRYQIHDICKGITNHLGGSGRGFGDICFSGARGNFPFIPHGVKPVKRANLAARKSRYRALKLIEKSTFFYAPQRDFLRQALFNQRLFICHDENHTPDKPPEM